MEMAIDASHVEALFRDTAKMYQRSCRLVDERVGRVSTPSGPSSPTPTASFVGAAPSTSSHDASTSTNTISSSFSQAVAMLRALAEVRGFVIVAASLLQRLALEMREASTGIRVQREQRGARFPLLRRTVRGLCESSVVSGLSDGGGTSAVRTLLQPTTSSSSLANADGCSLATHVAKVSRVLVEAAFCVDAAYLSAELVQQLNAFAHRHAGPLTAQEQRWLMPDLYTVLAPITDLFTPAMNDALAERMLVLVQEGCGARGTNTSPSSPTSSTAAAAGFNDAATVAPTILLPGLLSVMMECGTPELWIRIILDPLRHASMHLLQLYLGSPTQFSASCEAITTQIVVIAALVLHRSTSTVKVDASIFGDVLKMLCSRLTYPLEESFTANNVRPGMSAALADALVCPLVGKTGDVVASFSGGPPALINVLHTLRFRLLLLVERAGRGELSLLGGTRSAAAIQRRYASYLAASGGKITIAVLQSVAEDRGLSLTETTMRSSTAHKIYRLAHSIAAESSITSFVYLSNGIIYVKRGRVAEFRQAKSMEEVFRPYEEEG